MMGACKNLQEIENVYQNFKEANVTCQSDLCVEYIGVNFSEDVTINPVFKVYYKTRKSLEYISPIILPLKDSDMIRVLNRIDDNINKGVRYEIGLKNRTNKNMMSLYDYLYEIMPNLKMYRAEIRRFEAIRCSDLADFRYSSLYFVGIIGENNCGNEFVKAIKLHYLLRKCLDPEKIGKDYVVDNKVWLDTLVLLGISEIKQISLLIEELLRYDDAELWIVAVDYYHTIVKYKIYLKKIQNSLILRMIRLFEDNGYVNLAMQIRAYLEWSEFHSELCVYGIAICLDNNGVWSVNFYH